MSELPIKRSEQVNELFAALAKAKLNYKTVVRTRENTYTNSKYADLQDLIDATQSALASEGITIIQIPLEDLANKRAGSFTLLGHSSGQYLSTEFYLPAVGKASGGAEKLDAQTVGAAVQYSKRYTYSGFSGVVGEAEDDGNQVADKSADAPAPPKPKTVSAPPVNRAPAKTGGDRPQEKPPGFRVIIPQQPAPGRSATREPLPEGAVKPLAVQQPATETSVAPFDAVTPDPNAQFHPETANSANAETPVSSEQPADTSEKPTKSQLDTYISKIRDDIRPTLEKAGLKASRNIAVGAKLKIYLLSAFGNPGVKELTDLTVKQWDNFVAAFEATDSASFALKVEEANKK